MDTNQIRYFVTLARTLNFSRAAELHGITQPALTKAVQKLEANLGGKLIYRDGRDTRLTELGKSALDELEAIATSSVRVNELAELSASGQQRNLVLGIASTIVPRNFSKLMRSIIEKLPETRITIESIEPKEMSRLMLTGDLDCCLWSDFKGQNTKLSTLKLYSEKLLLACAPSHRFAKMKAVPVEELKNEPYLERLKCEFRHSAGITLKQKGINLRRVLQSDREDWVQQMVAGNIGICSLPEYSRLVPDLVLRPIIGLELQRNIHFVTIFGSTRSEAAKQVGKIVKAEYSGK